MGGVHMGLYDNKLSSLLNRVILEADGDDDDVSAGESDNFMDDDEGDASGDTTGTSDDDVSAGESDNFMDDDEGSNNTTEDENDDVSSGESDNFMDDSDDNTDNSDGDEDGNNDSDSVDSGESDNFMDDDEGGEDGTTDGESEEEGEGSEEEENQGEEEGDELDINKIEDELFSSLTPEQIAIKNHELKNQFIEVYTIIGSTLVRINDIPKSNDNINILKFVTEKLLELREMVDYNITVAYTTRTYIENNIIYQQCIATLNAIADIIDNIPNVNGADSNVEHKKEEEEKEDLGEPVEPEENEGQNQLDVSDISTASDYQEESYQYNDSYSDDSDINDLF
jgi:hypothetical protein